MTRFNQLFRSRNSSYDQKLSLADVERYAPSALAKQAASKMTERYQFLPTLNIIQVMASNGWYPVRAQEMNTHTEDRKGFVKHLLRFRQFEKQLSMIGDTLPEIILLNSHDGSCSLQLFMGLFRMVCLNGLVVCTENLGKVKARHIATNKDVIDTVGELVEDLPKLSENVNHFQNITLSLPERTVFAETAIEYVWKDNVPVTPEQVLQPRRVEDNIGSLWHTYNIVQENLTTGGLTGKTEAGKIRRTSKIKSIDKYLHTNKALWSLTQKMAELKNSNQPIITV